MKKRIFSLLLTCMLMLSLMPTALAANVTLPEMPDVFQGNGVYVTAKELPIPEGWTVYGGVPRGVHEGFVTVFRTEDVQDENGFYTGGKRYLVNWVDEEGNLFDFSDWETPPTLLYNGPYESQKYSFHDGLCYFYDEEKDAFGYIDTEGNKVIEAAEHGELDFYNGYAVASYYGVLIDKTGKVVFSLEELGLDGSIEGEYSDGLLAYSGYLDAERDTYFVGWINLEGEPVITLYSGDRSDYDWNENLDFGTSTFSEGYAFVKDGRGGGSYPNYILIDTEGNEILTLEPEAPVYISGIYGGEDYTTGAPGKVRGGRFWVHYVDTTPGIDSIKAGIDVLMDVEGNELFRYYRPAEQGIHGTFDNGVALNGHILGINGLVFDINNNPVVPFLTVEKNGETVGNLSATIGFNEDNQTLGVLSGMNETYYVLEAHQGTYTGPGTVYDAETGQITGNGTAPVQPESNTPSAWAAEQVSTAISNGIVPETLQSHYTQATTRAEFCALAVDLYETVKGTEITERATFTDTTDLNVQKMAGLGVVNGVGDGKFTPNGVLTREQAATMLSHLAEVMDKPLAAQTPTFADNASISSWAADAVGQMQRSGVMSGVGNNTFSPQGSYTREQSIVTMLRLYEIVK